MKKIYIGLAMIAAIFSLNACVNEQNVDEYTPGKNELVLNMKSAPGKVETKSVSEAKGPRVIIPLATEDGTQLFLEETVTSLDGSNLPETKGTPVYTENAANVEGYETFNGIAYKAGTTTVALDDAKFTVASTGTWHHVYGSDPLANGDIQLCMPADFIDNGKIGQNNIVSNLTYNVNTTWPIEFDYVSPLDAEGQKDLLFAARTLSNNKQSSDYYDPKNGADVLFYHALTGVKFRIANKAEEISKNGISINSVTFTGLQTSGHCKIKPVTESGKYVDKATDYSSATAVSWGGELSTSQKIGQEFNGTVDLSKTSNVPESFLTAGTQNLNKEDASQTFWLIPQTITKDLTLTVNYTLNGTDYNVTINFGEKLLEKKANLQWLPGELRTYSLNVNVVGITITDEITNGVKSNVTITNTGNCPEFVRVKLTANWVDDDGNIVVGYQNNTTGPDNNGYYTVPSPDPFLTPWTLNLSSNTPSVSEGTFNGFPGENWDYTTMNDGYIYYTKPIDPGNPSSSSIFNTFTITNYVKKAYVVANPVTQKRDEVEVHLDMEILVQSIEATEEDQAATEGWKIAWTRAQNN